VIHWNEAALKRALGTPEMQEATDRLAESLADEVRTQRTLVEGEPGILDLPVEVYQSDDADTAASAVVLAHPAGLAVQAKHGSLTKAASALGLEVQG
jgi:hypothetical protein